MLLELFQFLYIDDHVWERHFQGFKLIYIISILISLIRQLQQF